MSYIGQVQKYQCSGCKERRDGSCKPYAPNCELKVPILEQCLEPHKVDNLVNTLSSLNMGVSIRKDGKWNIVPIAVLQQEASHV